ncbi:hypothetical protein J6590_049852 [Homalodisca vitripennis]|nr:hypothetical protein J6590_049852 [Homalodisca vitripennis]
MHQYIGISSSAMAQFSGSVVIVQITRSSNAAWMCDPVLASSQPARPLQKPMYYFNLGNLMDVQKRHITNRICRDSGVHGQFDRSSLLWEMTVGVGGVCSLTSEVLVNLNKGVPHSACFDWRGWLRTGLLFFRGDMT